MIIGKISVGEKVICIVDYSSYSNTVRKGTILTVQNSFKSGGQEGFYAIVEGVRRHWFPNYEFDRVPVTPEAIKNEIKKKTEEIAELQAKLHYLVSNRIDFYDEEQFKVFRTLQILKTKKKDVEKVKIIAELIKK